MCVPAATAHNSSSWLSARTGLAFSCRCLFPAEPCFAHRYPVFVPWHAPTRHCVPTDTAQSKEVRVASSLNPDATPPLAPTGSHLSKSCLCQMGTMDTTPKARHRRPRKARGWAGPPSLQPACFSSALSVSTQSLYGPITRARTHGSKRAACTWAQPISRTARQQIKAAQAHNERSEKKKNEQKLGNTEHEHNVYTAHNNFMRVVMGPNLATARPAPARPCVHNRRP